MADAAGNLFGTTSAGGANDCGTVFEITDSGFTVGLFTTGNDNVDFNNLTDTQKSVVGLGSDIYNALAGDDKVVLPTDNNAANLGGAGVNTTGIRLSTPEMAPIQLTSARPTGRLITSC